MYRCPPEELCKKYPLKKYSWKEKKTIAKSFVIGTTTQQEVIDILGVGITGSDNPPVIDSLGYRCKSPSGGIYHPREDQRSLTD